MADSIVRLRIDSQEFDSKLKIASQNLQAYFDKVKQGGGTFEYLDEGVLECARAIGQMATQAKTVRGSVSELTSSFTEWSLRYKQMTDAEKSTPLGKEIKNSLDQLKTRIKETKKDLADINQELSGSKFGQFGSLIDGVGKQMGLNANITELLTSKTALMTAGIGASIAVVGKATSEWKKYNDELSKQDQITTVTTGLKGEAAEGMTDAARALADTYNVDFRQAIEAANMLMTQFGQTGDQAMQLLRDGMQGMIQGDGPKLLSMIKQYAPAFRDAGVSASQLVAVIHNTEGGIFTDQNMQSIVIGIRNIRLMTKQTSDALAQLGIDGQKMTQQLNDGSITVFDALKQVASKLREVDSNSKTAGEVMQYVFGRTGVMAGTNIAKAIETLNTNLEETKRQTGEVGEAFAELQIASNKLNTAIRDAFGYDGWQELTIGIRSALISTLAEVIDKLGKVKGLVVGITPGQAKREKYGTAGTPDEVTRDLESLRQIPEEDRAQAYESMRTKYEKRFREAVDAEQRAQQAYDVDRRGTWVQRYNPGQLIGTAYDAARLNSARLRVTVEESVMQEFTREARKILDHAETDTNGANSHNEPPTISPGTPSTKEVTIQQKISELEKEALTASEQRREEIRATIQELDRELAKQKEIVAALHEVPADAVSTAYRDMLRGGRVQLPDEAPMSTARVGIMPGYLTQPVTDAPTALQAAQYEAAKSVKAEDVKVDTSTLQSILRNALQEGIDTATLNLDGVAEQIGRGINVPDETWQGILDEYNALREAIGQDPIEIDFKTGKLKELKENSKGLAGDWQNASSAIQAVGSALGSIEDPAAKVAGIVAQAIATVSLTFASSLKGTVTPWDWIAAAAAGTATMVSTIATIKSSTKGGFAEGGIVPGNSYSGDNLRISDYGINSGELILSRSQQDSIAAQLTGDDGQTSGGGVPYVTGETLFLGMSNTLRRQGRGEIVTTSMLRRAGIRL